MNIRDDGCDDGCPLTHLHLDITASDALTTAMRTTIDIDDDVLVVAKELARAEGRTMGQVISDLARRALTQPVPGMGLEESQVAYVVDDFPAFPLRDGSPVTSETVRRLQDTVDMEDAEAWDHDRGQSRSPTEFLPGSTPKSGRARG